VSVRSPGAEISSPSTPIRTNPPAAGEDQLPDEVVECRAEVVQELPSPNAPARIGLLSNPESADEPIAFSFKLVGNRVRMTLVVRPDLVCKEVQVLFGPVELEAHSDAMELERRPGEGYTEEQMDRALVEVALCAGNTHAAHRNLTALGFEVPRETLRTWATKTQVERYQRVRAELVPLIHAKIAAVCEDTAELAGQLEREMIVKLAKDDKELASAARPAGRNPQRLHHQGHQRR
jgi:hypothetical protein